MCDSVLMGLRDEGHPVLPLNCRRVPEEPTSLDVGMTPILMVLHHTKDLIIAKVIKVCPFSVP